MERSESVKRALFVFWVALLLVLPLALSACGGERSIKGQVASVDATTRTFSVQATDGKKYDFKVPSGSAKVDLTQIKEHMDEKKEIEVRYTGDSAPYEATYAH